MCHPYCHRQLILVYHPWHQYVSSAFAMCTFGNKCWWMKLPLAPVYVCLPLASCLPFCKLFSLGAVWDHYDYTLQCISMDNHHDEYASPCHAMHRGVVLNSTNIAGWKMHSLICIFTEYTSTAVVYLHCIHTLMGYIYTEYACLYIQCKYTLHAGAVLLVYIYLGCISQPNSAWGCIF